MRLSDEAFKEVVRNTPLVSIDLIARDPEGRVLVGLRTNEPARGSWFVPGGRIRKGETLAEAFGRLTLEELGEAHAIEAARFRGVYEHFYKTNRFGDPSFGTHYVVLAYELPLAAPLPGAASLPEEQHGAYRWVSEAELSTDETIHPNSRAYARGAAER